MAVATIAKAVQHANVRKVCHGRVALHWPLNSTILRDSQWSNDRAYAAACTIPRMPYLNARTVVCIVAIAALVGRWTDASAQALRLPSPTVSYTTGERGAVTGPIISRDGDNFLVRDETTGKVSAVHITDETKISSPSGFLNLERTPQPPTTLIAGLIIEVKGRGSSRGNLVADRISFRRSDLRVATQISAGEVELRARERQTAAIAEANRDSLARATLRARDSLDAVNARISNIDTYDLRVRGTVNFVPNSAALTEEGKEILDDLFDKSRKLEGYIIEVAGFTDATESPIGNRELSARRAESVVAYLSAVHAVPLWRFATPVGFGAERAVATNETAEGRALNRRVELRVLASRGLRAPPLR